MSSRPIRHLYLYLFILFKPLIEWCLFTFSHFPPPKIHPCNWHMIASHFSWIHVDFDGDQIVIHVPSSLEAQSKARLLMFLI
ncbi:unnamed protein product, partial [Vitis vinifera]|uniref:Uncharacterized protein n=1 Tax=Vitis vinifera TaxID=29760 RepID=D7TME1_VITVI